MTAPDADRFIRTDSGYLMVLRQGDDVFAHLIALTRRMNIPSASLVGLDARRPWTVRQRASRAT